MEKNKELIKNTIIILIGKFCTQFLSFFLLPLYTHVLSTEEYGMYDLIVTYVTLFAPVISLQIEMAIFRELIDSRNDESKTNTIISSGVAFLLLQFAFCVILYYVLTLFINIPYKHYILLNILIVMMSSVFMQITRGLGKTMDYSISSVIAGVSTIFLNILFLVFLKFKIEGMIISSILSNFLVVIYVFFRCKIYKRIKIQYIKKQTISKLLKYSMPLVPNGLIWWIINVSDRTIISIFLGTAANGVYAIANKFSSILMQIFNIFNLSWTESASLHINDADKDEFFSNVFNKTIKYSLTICLLIISSLPFLFNVFINKEYNEAYIYIPILLIGVLFNIVVSFLGSIYVAKKLTKEVAKTSLFAGLLNVIINLCLIKYIGVFAAAISTVLSFFIMCIFRMFDVQKYVKIKLNYKENLLVFILFLISIGIYYFKNLYVSMPFFILSVIYVFIDNKSYIVFIFSKMNGYKNKKK